MNPNNPFEGLENITPDSPQPSPVTPSNPPSTNQSVAFHSAAPAPTQTPTWKPTSNASAPRSRRGIVFSAITIILVGVLGGGYYAYSQGYVDVPFLPTAPNRVMTKLVLSADELKQAQYTFGITVKTEPRNASEKAISMNAADTGTGANPFDQYGLMLGTATDIDGEATLSFYYEYAQPAATSNGFLTLSAVDTNNSENDLALEIRKVGLDVYGRVTKLPTSLGTFLDIDSLVGTWIHLTGGDASLFDDANVKDLSLQEQIDEMKLMMGIATETKVLKTMKRVGVETIGDVATERFTFAIDSTKLEAFFQSLIDDFKSRNKPVTELEQALKSVRGDEGKQLREFFDASTFDIWIEKSTGLIRQFSTTVLIDRGSGKQVRTNIRMTLDKLNQTIPVERPVEAKEFEELMADVVGAPNVETPTADGSSFLATIERDRVGACYLSRNPTALSLYPEELRESYRGYAEVTQPDSLCEGLSDTQVAAAGQKLSTDADTDRLNLFLEEVYGSSDTKADTDGDSFSDLQEINNGYNPNGPGSLIDGF